jgi:hypothetical protein
MIAEEITLELARLERRAYERVRSKIAAQCLGEAWIDLPDALVERGSRDVASELTSASPGG